MCAIRGAVAAHVQYLVRLTVLPVALAGWTCAPEPTGLGVRERWFAAQVDNSSARPAVWGDVVFFGTGDGKVIARDFATGGARWVARVDGGRIDGANFVVNDGVVAVATGRSTVAFDVANGRELWRYSAPPDTALGASGLPGQLTRTHLAIDDEHVYVPAWGASVSAVGRRSGVARWVWLPGRFPTDTATHRFRSGSMGVRVSGDTVFAAGWHFTVANGVRSEAWIVALERMTGRELWRTTIPSERGGTVFAAPGLSGGVVVLGLSSGKVAAVHRATGASAWTFQPPMVLSPLSQAEADDDAVYADGGDGFVRAFDPATGAEKWRAAFSSQTSADLVVSERNVYAPVGGVLYVFDRQTGRRVTVVQQPRIVEREGSFFSSPVEVARGRAFVTVHQGAWSFDEP